MIAARPAAIQRCGLMRRGIGYPTITAWRQSQLPYQLSDAGAPVIVFAESFAGLAAPELLAV